MADIATKSKVYILPGFSSVPRTSKIEADRDKLLKDFEDFNKFEQSQELKDFYELQEYINSKEFSQLQEKIAKEKSEENARIASFQDQKKSKVFRKYFQFGESQKLKDHKAFASSKELADYLELEKLVLSAAFSEQKKKAEKLLDELNQKEKELKNLEKSSNIRFFHKFSVSPDLERFRKIAAAVDSKKKAEEEESADSKFYRKFRESAKYKRFNEIEKSAELKKYNDLKAETGSAEFRKSMEKAGAELKELKAKLEKYNGLKKSKPFRDYFRFAESARYKDFVAFSDSKQLKDYLELEKYLQSEEHRNKLAEITKKEAGATEKKKDFEEFRNSKKYKWYTGLKDSDVFDELKKWELTFSDEFNGNNLDREKWLARYFWGEKLINDAYGQDSDHAFPTDGKNITIKDSILKIELRREMCSGKVWKPPFGFVPKEFEYTTGLINTGKSFWQKYGKIEAKIRVNFARPAQYSFWMTTGKILPHIDIMRLEKNKSNLTTAHFWGDTATGKTPEHKLVDKKGPDVSKDFFIYTLEWTKEKLVWKINGVVVNEQTQGVPQEEMCIAFSLNLLNRPVDSKLPLSMEIDWVRCYKQA